MNRPYRCAATIHPVRLPSKSIDPSKAKLSSLSPGAEILIYRGGVEA
jgi:hypothetical protein